MPNRMVRFLSEDDSFSFCWRVCTGGKAAYPSSVLMNIVPAKVAGVEKIVMVTPPNKDGEVTPATLVAANEAGATHIYKVGGAQATVISLWNRIN